MPQNVKRLVQIQERFADAMHEHLQLIQALQAVTEKMGKFIEVFGSNTKKTEDAST